MSKLRQFTRCLLLILILHAIFLLSTNSVAEDDLNCEKLRPSEKLANFKISQSLKSKIHTGTKTSLLIVETPVLHGLLTLTRLLQRIRIRGLLHLVRTLKKLHEKYLELILLDTGDIIQ